MKMSRIEEILQAIIDETSYSKEPQSRIEEILLAIKNNTQYIKLPQSRIEEILLAIKNGTEYTEALQSRIEEILLAKLHNTEYTKLPQSRIEELLIKWLNELINTSTISSDTISVGESVIVTGSAIGGTTPYVYAILYKKSTDTKWATIQSFNTNNVVSIRPTKAPKYDIRVIVKDATDTEKIANFVVTITNIAQPERGELDVVNLKNHITLHKNEWEI